MMALLAFCVSCPSAGQTMWSDTWILILPLLNFVNIWHRNQYFSQGECTKSPVRDMHIYVCTLEWRVKWLSESWFACILLVCSVCWECWIQDMYGCYNIYLPGASLTVHQGGSAITSPTLDEHVRASKFRWFTKRTHRTQYLVILVTRIYYNKKIQSKSAKGKCACGKIEGSKAQVSKIPIPVALHKTLLTFKQCIWNVTSQGSSLETWGLVFLEC
jgi:hypothetical protein